MKKSGKQSLKALIASLEQCRYIIKIYSTILIIEARTLQQNHSMLKLKLLELNLEALEV
jgi:hypothetical protein